jgi:anti-sigma regulatory factor (Ser/Thr protein kinase)
MRTDDAGCSGRGVSWEHRLSPHVSSIGEARRRARCVLAAHTDPATLERVELVVSELVTNSVRHGPGRPITLRLSTEVEGAIAGEVEDHGEGVVAIPEQREGSAGGLGLHVVDQLTSGWGVHPGSTSVWFRFDPRKP